MADESTTQNPFGPVQMLVLGFDRTEFDGTVMPELDRLKEAGIARLIDMILVKKENGEVSTVQRSDLTTDEAEDFGALVGALIGAGTGDAEVMEQAIVAGAADGSDGHVLDEEDVWYLADAIPEGKSAVVALIEHLWAIPLREKLQANDAVVLADAWIHPADLIAVGAIAAEVARSQS
jgi:uncharacterized membrane protein